MKERKTRIVLAAATVLSLVACTPEVTKPSSTSTQNGARSRATTDCPIIKFSPFDEDQTYRCPVSKTKVYISGRAAGDFQTGISTDEVNSPEAKPKVISIGETTVFERNGCTIKVTIEKKGPLQGESSHHRVKEECPLPLP